LPNIAVATIVAKKFLSFARVLAESFHGIHPGIPFFVLLADETDGYFDPASEPFDIVWTFLSANVFGSTTRSSR
jgi:hypothetical protein